MDWLRQLRPMHGWRGFFGEVGIVVLGVLLALGAQQLVEAWQWRQEVDATRIALTSEIADNLANAAERQMADECLRGRLKDLMDLLQSPDPDWKGNRAPLAYREYVEAYRDFPIVYRSPYLHWTDSVWQSAKTSGVLNHMDRSEVINFSLLYASIAFMRDHNYAEERVYPRLLYLGFDRRLDEATRREAIAQIGELHWSQEMIFEEADVAYRMARTMHLDFSHTDFAKQLQDREHKQRRFRGECVRHVNPPI